MSLRRACRRGEHGGFASEATSATCTHGRGAFDKSRKSINAPNGRPAKVRYAPDTDVLKHGSETMRWARSRLMQRTKLHPYSITSSARPSSVGGTVRPSTLAVLRLITSSNLVGFGFSVGYEDPTFLRRLFKRRAGLTPAAYSRKFAGILSVGN
jgi:hypothetical protein